jgi:type IV pilus assembly protein PilV
MRSSQHAGNASIAVSLARDYGEFVQTVPAWLVESSGSAGSAFFLDTSTLSSTSQSGACTGVSAACTPAQLIQSGVQEWAARVSAQLPQGRAKVCRDASPTNTSDGSYSWVCDDTGDMIVVKFGWVSKANSASTAGDTLLQTDAPRIVMSLFGNTSEYSTIAPVP